MLPEDLALVGKFMKSENILPENTRAFKLADKHYVVTIGSADISKKEFEFDGCQFEVQHGEFSPYLTETVNYLKKALENVANETQGKMLEKYIESFSNGSTETHKDSQRHWVKDLSPSIETNMGWVETYIDPEGFRAYWEGLVAIVDKEKSKKFQKLVEISEGVVPKLPWPAHMEKDKFLAPDFTTLEVITMATNGCPLGINIPNYDDIRETDGFKNVYLNNSMGTVNFNAVEFATEE